LSSAWTTTLEALSWVELKGMNEDAALRKTLKQIGIKNLEVTRKASELLYAVSKRRNALDYLINQALESSDIEALDIGVRNFLRIYSYMVHYGGNSGAEVQRFVEHIRGILGKKTLKVVEEAIDIIPHQRIPWGSLSRAQALAFENFLPLWYVEYVCANFEEGIAADLMSPIDIPKYIRINTLRGGESLIPQLNALGFRFEAVPGVCYAYKVLGGSEGLTDTTPYRGGDFIMQDKASILVGEVAAPRPGNIVLDICAAPGIKTSHLAQIMSNRGRIISVDINAGRLKSWKRLMERMGVSIGEPVIGDASKVDELPKIIADLVLLDPPCSGTGTFNSIPSTKWRVTRASINEYATLQSRLLENAAAHVRPGGSLVYSTCSISVEENEGVVEGFLMGHPEFKIVEANPRLGAPGLRELVEALRLYPKTHECESFFIAKLLLIKPDLS
jgi:16S rRNA (cytosine967-C5)-methyltransferase